jgi:hypothetical protein
MDLQASTSAQELGANAGIMELMDDLGKAMTGNSKVLMLGGGNPAGIPDRQKIWHEVIARPRLPLWHRRRLAIEQRMHQDQLLPANRHARAYVCPAWKSARHTTRQINGFLHFCFDPDIRIPIMTDFRWIAPVRRFPLESGTVQH